MKEKQIEEMAKNVCHLDRTCDQCMTSFECKAMIYAKRFYNAGYRKTSDIAREIFEEIEKMLISNHIESYMTLDDTWIHRFKNSILINLNELRKKYTEEGK